MWRITVTALLSCILTWAVAADSIQPAPDGWSLMASLGQKAVVKLDGRQYRLRLNQPHSMGYELKSVQSSQVVIRYQGQDYLITKQQKSIRTNYKAPVKQSIHIPMDRSGHYSANVQINGFSLDALIDTGATTVALNQQHAKKIGLQYDKQQRVQVQTASGVTYAYAVHLKSVRIGAIELKDVQGMVLPGGLPSRVLIGMTFLSRVDVQHKDMVMTLESRL